MNVKEALERYYHTIEIQIQDGSKSQATLDTYKKAIKRFYNFFQLEEQDVSFIENITKLQFEDFINSLTTLNPRSKNGVILAIGVFLGYLKEKEIIKDEVITKTKIGGSHYIDEKKKPVVSLTFEEAEKIIHASKNLQEKFMFRLMLNCALRAGEVASLKPSDFKEDRFFELKRKGGNIRRLRMNQEVYKLYIEYMAKRDNTRTFLFYHISGKNKSDITRGLESQSINVRLKAALERTDIPEDRKKQLTSHVFRKTAVTEAIRRTKSLEVGKQVAGHTSIVTTQKCYNNALDLGTDYMSNNDSFSFNEDTVEENEAT